MSFLKNATNPLVALVFLFGLGCSELQESFDPATLNIDNGGTRVRELSAFSGQYILYSYYVKSREAEQEDVENHLGMQLEILADQEVILLKSQCGSSELVTKRIMSFSMSQQDSLVILQPKVVTPVGEACPGEQEQKIELATEALRQAQNLRLDNQLTNVYWLETRIVDVSLRLVQANVSQSLMENLSLLDNHQRASVIVQFTPPQIDTDSFETPEERDAALAAANHERVDQILAGAEIDDLSQIQLTRFNMTPSFAAQLTSNELLRVLDQPGVTQAGLNSTNGH
jgi:hypothetical protein